MTRRIIRSRAVTSVWLWGSAGDPRASSRDRRTGVQPFAGAGGPIPSRGVRHPVALAGQSRPPRAPRAEDLIELRDLGYPAALASTLELSLSPDRSQVVFPIQRAISPNDSYCAGLVVLDPHTGAARLLDRIRDSRCDRSTIAARRSRGTFRHSSRPGGRPTGAGSRICVQRTA
jgi:hypothetical protein